MNMNLGVRNFFFIILIFFHSSSVISKTLEGSLATIQILDKITAKVNTFEIKVDSYFKFQTLEIQIYACHKKPPEEIPENFVLLKIFDSSAEEEIELIYQDIDVFSKVNKQEGILSSVFRDTNITNFFQKAYENFDELDEKRVVEVSNKILLQPSNKNDLKVTDIKITNKKISFFTNNPGELHLIKVSYFPNWSISNGLGPFRTSPSFMSVIPNQEYVEINFEKTTLEKNSFYFSIFSLVLSLIIFIRSLKNVKKT